MIVAGAGTGKTSVITKRIAWLIESGAAKPDEILALTFTDKAATEMEARVFDLLPIGMANMQISTFHAFGDQLLRDHSFRLGLPPTFRLLSEAEQMLVLSEHLFELELDVLRPHGNPAAHVNELIKLFSRLKDDAISPQQYAQWAKKHSTNEEPYVAKRTQETVAAYAAYERYKLEQGAIDFADQVYLALKLLKEHPDVLRALRSKLRYILVDEFQDTNVIQSQLVSLISGKDGNLSVVGDDDQSIYAFRGASLSNILDFKREHPNATEIVLTENYRSTELILEPSYRLIQHNNPHRLEYQDKLDKRLRAQRRGEQPVEFIYELTVWDEADRIAEEIEVARAAGTTLREIAILCRDRSIGDTFRGALAQRGIAAHYGGTETLYDRAEIRMCVSFLRCVVNPLQSTHLYAVAVSDIYSFPIDDLTHIEKDRRLSHRELWDVLDELDESYSGQARNAAIRLKEDIRKFAEAAPQENVGQLLYRWLNEHTGYVKKIGRLESAEDAVVIENLSLFFNRLKAFSDTAQTPTATEWVRYFDTIIQYETAPVAAEIDSDEEAVQIMTMHAAKGLEFDVVFVVGCAKGRLPGSFRRPQLLPGGVLRDQQNKEENVREERRLLYVAMTRAKQRLVLSAAANYEGKRTDIKPSDFVIEALGQTVVTAAPARKKNPLKRIEQSRPEALRAFAYSAPEQLVLSYSKLHAYLNCPLGYFWDYVVRAYTEPDPTLIFGDVMHALVRDINIARGEGDPLIPEEVTRRFTETWKQQRFLASRPHAEDLQKRGLAALLRYLESDVAKRPAKAVEQSFSFVVGGALVEGRYDRIDEAAGATSVIDYKTGTVANQEAADTKAKTSDQLTLYALALFETTGTLPEAVSLYFLDSGLIGSSQRTEKQLETMRQKIQDVGEGIRRGDFEPKRTSHLCSPVAYNHCPGNTRVSKPEV
jgi:DNA helicase-2/ATP-dependent DNA helicase PcrA